MEIADLQPFVRRAARFLPQLAFDCGEPVLVRGVQLSGRDLQDHAVQRVAVLPLHDDFVVFRNGNDADRADMADHFAHGRIAVGEGDRVPFHMKNDAVEDVLRGQLFFREALPFAGFVKDHNPFPFSKQTQVP